MRLKTIHITNFRSVEDSTEFEVGAGDNGQVLCLVGKNEAGKTAILQALAGLNPHPLTPFAYELERDYPRRWLTEYKERHGGGQARIVSTQWEIPDSVKEEIKAEIGDGLTNGLVTVYRSYGDKEPQWEGFPYDIEKAIAHLLSASKLDEEEQQPLKTAKNSDELRKTLEAMTERSNKQDHLLEKINSFPNKNVRGFVESKIKPLLPQFMYSSHFDRMAGQLRVDNFAARKAANGQPPVTPGELIFLDFLQYAGTSLEEIAAANTYESLNARCEAASSRITSQLLDYWTQNPNIEVEVRLTKAEPKDTAPFNEGVISRARVKNNLHKLTLPFSERSAGFVWFFSFLVKFAQVQKTGGNLLLLLDEPGLTLHGKAQEDLLRYFDEKLAPKHQVIYSTHSPFMVPANNLPSVRIVEDRIYQPRAGQWTSDGTKVRDDTLATDRDTLFPLQGALGYELTQTLFIGKHNLLVEGPGDILYLYAWSAALIRRGKPGLDRRWSVCPAGGIDKIQPFVSLFSGQKLDIAALTDYAKADKRKFESLRQNKVLESDRLLTFASILGLEEADIEDVFSPVLFASIVNQAFTLPADKQLTADKIAATEAHTTRLVKKTEAYFAVLGPDDPQFDHFTPADWLFRNSAVLDADSPEVNETLGRAEKVIATVNKILTA